MMKFIGSIITVLALAGCSHQVAQPIPTPEPPAKPPSVVTPAPPPPAVIPSKPVPVKPPTKPVPPSSPPKVTAPAPAPKPCVKGGCSSQLCIEEGGSDGISTCEFKLEYACYRNAKCERQKSGSCGWTPSAELSKCIEEAQKPAPQPAPAPTPVVTPSPAPAPQTVQATIQGFAFKGPDGSNVIKIKKGDTVTWTQQDGAPHNVVSDSGSELTGPLLSMGQTYSHVFNTVGTFAYHCAPHPSMKGTVVVE